MPAGSGASSPIARISVKGGELMPAAVKTYSFSVVLAGISELTPEIADALYEAGCDDAGVGTCDGILTVDFDREADSLGDAIGSAVKDVERAGCAIARIIIEEAANH
jgi:hypothetical protein